MRVCEQGAIQSQQPLSVAITGTFLIRSIVILSTAMHFFNLQAHLFAANIDARGGGMPSFRLGLITCRSCRATNSPCQRVPRNPISIFCLIIAIVAMRLRRS
jgi:hypothetical protein